MISPMNARRIYPQGPALNPLGLGTLRVTPQNYTKKYSLFAQAQKKGFQIQDLGLSYGNHLSPFLVSRLPFQERAYLLLKCALPWSPDHSLDQTWIQHQIQTHRWISSHPPHQTCLMINEPEGFYWFQPDASLSSFEKKLFQVFETLETLCLVKGFWNFGISSQILSQGPQHPLAFFSSSLFTRLAKEFPHFKLIQAPLNWLESPFLFEDFLPFLKTQELGFIGIRPFQGITKKGDLLKFIQRPKDQRNPEFQIWTDFLQELLQTLQKAWELNKNLASLTLATLLQLPGVSCVLTSLGEESDLKDALDSCQIWSTLSAKDIYHNIQDHLYELGF